jgi:hypothetical protein
MTRSFGWQSIASLAPTAPIRQGDPVPSGWYSFAEPSDPASAAR